VKRITVWIDSKDDSIEQVREKLKGFSAQTGLRYKIVETCELIEPEESK
jgi:hypothetical protein